MKKKVKDLTQKEFDKICSKYDDSCVDCPFVSLDSCRELKAYLKFQNHLRILEQEIEVDENE